MDPRRPILTASTSPTLDVLARGIIWHRVAFVVAQSLDQLIESVLCNYVKFWLARITVSELFLSEVRRAAESALSVLSRRLQQRDIVHDLVMNALPVCTDHIESFVRAESKISAAPHLYEKREGFEEDPAMEVVAKFKSGHLHMAASIASLKSSAPQLRHLRVFVQDVIMSSVAPVLLKSPAVRSFVRELLSCAVLYPSIQALSDPDVIYQQIEAHGSALLRKQHPTLNQPENPFIPPRRLSDPVMSSNISMDLFSLSPDSSESDFMQLHSHIGECVSTSRIESARSQVLQQIQAYLPDTSNDLRHLRRLQTCEKMLTERLAKLNVKPSSNTRSSDKAGHPARAVSAVHRKIPNLRETLYDVAGLSYLMEFMDGLGLISYVQFWITADGFRVALDDQRNVDSSDPLQTSSMTWTEADRRMIERLHDRYLSQPVMRQLIAQSGSIVSFLRQGNAATPDQYHAACTAITQTQLNVYREMEAQYFSRFHESATYQQWMGAAAPPSSGFLEDDVGTGREGTITRSNGVRPQLIKSQQSLSSTEVATSTRKSALLSATRRSLDEEGGRSALFHDDLAIGADRSQPHGASVSELLDSGRGHVFREQTRRAKSPLDRTPEVPAGARNNIYRSSSDGDFAESRLLASQHKSEDRDRPSLNSLGLLGTPSRRTVFSAEDLFGENEQLWEEEEEEPSPHGAAETSEQIWEAQPGDLGLPEAVESLSSDIAKLEAQQGLLNSLTNKAELTNNAAELKILRKCLKELSRDLRRRELQRQQWIVQASDNSLYKKTKVSIASVRVNRESDGHEFATYEITLERQASASVPKASWMVTKRYSEFHDLNRRLCARYPRMRKLPFPKRQVVAILQTDFVQRRRATLEQYLRLLLSDVAACQSLELRAFLSERPIRVRRAQPADAEHTKRDAISRLFTALSEGLEDFVGNVTVLDQLSIAGQNLISATAATNLGMPGQAHNIPLEDSVEKPQPSLGMSADPTTSAEAQAEIAAFNRTAFVQNTSNVPGSMVPAPSSKASRTMAFIEPIALCFSTLFQTRGGNNWLRGRAVAIVLQQVLGGTVERRVRESFKDLTTATSMAYYITSLQQVLCPERQKNASRQERSQTLKLRSRRNAEEIMCSLFVEYTGSIIGRNAARDAGKRLIRCLAHESLNRHLLYTLMDLLGAAILDSATDTETQVSSR
ncbi:MAG: hypothetical protein Q9162_007320 [Coniocarpon cinnabarinum]